MLPRPANAIFLKIRLSLNEGTRIMRPHFFSTSVLTSLALAALAILAPPANADSVDHRPDAEPLHFGPWGFGMFPDGSISKTPAIDAVGERISSLNAPPNEPSMPIAGAQASVEVWNSIPPDYDGEVQNAATLTFWAISPNGQHIVGTVSEQSASYPNTSGLQRLEPFILTDGVMRTLELKDGALPIAKPYSVSDDGYVVGAQRLGTSDLDSYYGDWRPVIWLPDRTMTVLPTLDGFGIAVSIDQAAQRVVGWQLGLSAPNRATLWTAAGDGVTFNQTDDWWSDGVSDCVNTWGSPGVHSLPFAISNDGLRTFGDRGTMLPHCQGPDCVPWPVFSTTEGQFALLPPIGDHTTSDTGLAAIHSRPISARGNRIVYGFNSASCVNDPHMSALYTNGAVEPFVEGRWRQFWMTRSGGTIIYTNAYSHNSCFGGTQSHVYDDVNGHRNLLEMMTNEYGLSWAGDLVRGISADGRTIIGTNRTPCLSSFHWWTLGGSSWIIHLDNAPCAAPWFEQDPADGLAEAGEQLVFEAVVTGDGPIEVYWKKDGETITDGLTPHGSIISGSDTTTLTIDNFHPDDQGEYQIVASGPCGELHSYLATAQVGTPCASNADLNCDGVVNVSDLLILLGAWGACTEPDACPADLNDDGVVNVSDLLILLSNWG